MYEEGNITVFIKFSVSSMVLCVLMFISLHCSLMTFANSRCAANRSVLKRKEGKQIFLMLRDKQMYVCDKIIWC